MKSFKFFPLALVFIVSAISLKSQDMDTLSYAAGIAAGMHLKSNLQISEFDEASLVAAIVDYLNGKELKIDENQANQIIKAHINQKKMEQYKANAEAGTKFLEENGKRPEVTTTDSGLQYEVLKEGKGVQPTATQRVTVHYTGTLIDGTKFDSSVDRGKPATFPVNGVIQGWVEALQLMKEGAKWKLFIPYDLAYGERGAGPVIQPFSTLVFEVELLKVN